MRRPGTLPLGPGGVLGAPLDEALGRGLLDLDLDGGSLWLASELASLVADADPAEHALLVRALLALLAVRQGGSTLLPLSGDGTPEVGEIFDALGLDGTGQEALRKLLTDSGRVDALLGEAGGAPRPLLRLGEALCLRRDHEAEVGLASRLRARLQTPSGLEDPGCLDASTTRALASLGSLDETTLRAAMAEASAAPGAPPLTPAQQEAGVAALLRPLTIVTGGPGTGKTTIVATMLGALSRLAPEILPAISLTAPTGKAADRLGQGLKSAELPGLPPATTLHRLLGYRPRSDRFLHHAQNPLSAALVICDEASMIDLGLMDHLLRALLPGARLLLLGDADQLPPVGAGAVLRDLCASPVAGKAIQRLEKSHRQSEEEPGGASILRAASGLREGDASLLLPREAPSALAWEGAELLPASSESARRAFLSAWEERHLTLPPELADRLRTPILSGEGGQVAGDEVASLRALLEHHQRSRILCLTRIPAGGTGTLAVNGHFERRLAVQLGRAPSPLAPGTPVMVTHNDYAHGLFNGDTGLVVRARQEGGAVSPVALFPQGEGLRVYSLGSLADHLEPAWAITVHKAQGSEYDAVAVLLPTVEVRLLSREILYTAFTRARRSVVLVGESKQLENAVALQASRRTGLAALLEAG